MYPSVGSRGRGWYSQHSFLHPVWFSDLYLVDPQGRLDMLLFEQLQETMMISNVLAQQCVSVISSGLSGGSDLGTLTLQLAMPNEEALVCLLVNKIGRIATGLDFGWSLS